MKTNLILSILAFGLLAGKLTAQQVEDPIMDRTPASDQDEFAIAKKPFYLANKLVRPPVMAWDISKVLYSVKAENGGTLKYKTGTNLYVPKDAFVDELGKKVKGDVQIDYREFKDPLDFLFSGIPMTYDSGGATHTFESAGMFDIAASQNGKEIFLAKNKHLKMDFVSTDSSTSYNFYVLDESKGTWANKGKTDKPVTQTRNLKEGLLSPAVQSFLRFAREQRGALCHDTANLEERFKDTSYYYTTLKNPEDRNFLKDGADNYRDQNNKRQSLIRMTRVSSGRKGEIAFKMSMKYSEFPEMKVFAGKSWVLTDAETRTSFRAKYGSRNKFCDLRIEPSGDGYEMTIKKEDGFATFHAYPVSATQLKKKEHLPESTLKATASYRKIFGKREKMYDRDMVKAKLLNKNIKDKVTSERSYWAFLKKEMKPEEKRLGFEAWKDFCNEQAKKEKEMVLSASAGEKAIIRSLELDGMGVFNCDQIQRLSNPIVANAKYKEADGTGLKTTATYIVDNKINGVLRYDGFMGYSPSKIAYSAQSDNLLITIKEDGKVAYADKESFRTETTRNSTDPDFVMVEVDPAKMSVADFRKVLGFH